MTIHSPPVLLLTFNRPDHTRRVLDAIRVAKPARLYMASDGPREGRSQDAVAVAETRALVECIDWDCDVKTLFREQNLGCDQAVSQAISWFFEHEESGIILEDDCFADPSFFVYAAELLNRYRDNPHIGCISAQHFPGHWHQPASSYYLSRYNHCWGWASWRCAWQRFDFSMRRWPELRDTDWLLRIGNGSRGFRHYWARIFDGCHSGTINSWAYRWTFSCWSNEMMTLMPARNLVTNIGFGSDATHTRDSNPISARLPLEKLNFPLVHPPSLAQDIAADRWTDMHHFGITRRYTLESCIADLPGGQHLRQPYRWMKQLWRLT